MTPEKIKYGEKIDRPGLYNLPMAWHHADTCVGPSISSTGLRTIFLKTARSYWSTSIFNKDRVEADDDEEARHFRIGRAAHTLLLEPHLFREQFPTRPAIFDSWRSTQARKWRAEQVVEGRTVLAPDEMMVVQGVATALRGHNLHRDGILDGLIETSIVWRDNKTGIWLKARPDAIPASENMITDLKVTRDCSPRAVARSVRTFGYGQQAALAIAGMREVMKREIEDFVLVNVQADRSGDVHIAPLHASMIIQGMLRNRAALNTFAECMKTGYWPSWDARDNEYVGLSDRELEEQKLDIQAGILPKEF